MRRSVRSPTELIGGRGLARVEREPDDDELPPAAGAAVRNVPTGRGEPDRVRTLAAAAHRPGRLQAPHTAFHGAGPPPLHAQGRPFLAA